MNRSNMDDLQFCEKFMSEGGYNYYTFLSSGTNSRSVIMREKIDESEVKYFYGQGSTYLTDIANRASLNYKFPNEFGGSN